MSKELRSEAAREMGRARTERKTETGQENAAVARRARWADPEARAAQAEKMRETARKRWAEPGARERQAEAVRQSAQRRKEAKAQGGTGAEKTGAE